MLVTMLVNDPIKIFLGSFIDIFYKKPSVVLYIHAQLSCKAGVVRRTLSRVELAASPTYCPRLIQNQFKQTKNYLQRMLIILALMM